MIDVKQAVGIASQYLISLYGADIAPSVQLEEIELSEDARYWYITLSFAEKLPSFVNPRKNYKLFKIDGSSGQVQSMKIREVA